MLRFKNLGSGSSGNATVVEGRAGGSLGVRRLLVDCGLGLKQIETRLLQAGLAPGQIDAIFITHEHADHIGCARALAVKHRIPVWMSHGTHASLGSPDFGGLLQIAQDMAVIDLGVLSILPFTVPHDAREPLQLRCTDGASHLGILTDLGHASAHVIEQLRGCQALLIEANHDPDLLEASAYPAFLKRRVAGPWGHLSNQAAADILRTLQHPGLTCIVAAHLSEKNNTRELAQAALATAMGWEDTERVAVACPVEGTDWLTVP